MTSVDEANLTPDAETDPEDPAPEAQSEPAVADSEVESGEEAAAPLPPVSGEEFQALEAEKAELYDRWVRLQAEFDNFRKRTARERLQSREAAVDEITTGFLAVVDNFDRALAAAAESGLPEEHMAGWSMIHQQLYSVLASHNVQPMQVVGQLFDPQYHEAVAQIPHAEIAAGHVAAEVERGYLIGDRVLRVAKVAVSTGSATPE